MFTIKPRRDDERNWMLSNPILRYKEFIISYGDHGNIRYKLGDGIHHYNELQFVTLFDAIQYGTIYQGAKPAVKIYLLDREEQT